MNKERIKEIAESYAAAWENYGVLGVDDDICAAITQALTEQRNEIVAMIEKEIKNMNEERQIDALNYIATKIQDMGNE